MIRALSCLIFALMLLVPFGAGPAFAQQAPPAGTGAAPGAPPAMSEVPDAYIDEAMAYYDTCQQRNVMNQYYDCKCLSVKFLDQRVARGPHVNRDEIARSLQSECRDPVGAAGPAYNECLKTASTMKPGTDPEKMCACVGNTYAKMIARDKPVIDSRSMVRYKSMARVICESPETAQRLNLRAP